MITQKIKRLAFKTVALALGLALFLPGRAYAQSQATPPANPTQVATTQPPPAAGGLSGYMELHLTRPIERDRDPVLDLHRFVLLFTHQFSPRLRFVGELEVEHALVEGLTDAGELEVEQAYIDVLVRPWLNFRAGMMLVPIGIINERHEPPTFHGVERPLLDTVIIPSTWFDVGGGIHGRVGAWRYRYFLMAPLDSERFSAEEGLRGSLQKGSRAVVRDVAQTGRVEYLGVPGATIGASFWKGGSSVALRRFHTSTAVIEADGRVTRGPFEVRAQYAHVFIDGAGDINDSLARTTGVDPNVARQLRGFYIEGAVRRPVGAEHEVALFARFENVDTQFRMPAGWSPLPEFDRTVWTVGATYYLDPDVALKFDFTRTANRSLFRPLDRTLNFGLGWWF